MLRTRCEFCEGVLPARPKKVYNDYWCGCCASGRAALYANYSVLELAALRDTALAYVETHPLSLTDSYAAIDAWMSAFDQFSDCTQLLDAIGFDDADFPNYTPSESLICFS